MAPTANSPITPFGQGAGNQVGGANQVGGVNQMAGAGQVGGAQGGSLPPIVTNPTKVYNNIYQPMTQPIIHPIEIINQHHIVPVPKHICTYTCKNVQCSSRKRGTSRVSSKASSKVVRKTRTKRGR